MENKCKHLFTLKDMEGVINMKDLLKLNLQFFADENSNDNDGEENTREDNNQEDTEQEQQEPERKYTDDDVDKIVNQKFKKWQKEREDAIEEAKKLERMNKEQREQHEREKLERELAEYKRKDQYYQLSREASKMLSEHDITADDELLSMVVKDTAEDTQESVNAFVSLLNQKVEAGVKKALSGSSPKVTGQNTKAVSPEEFKNMTYQEVAELKANHPEKYKKLMNIKE